MNNTPTKPRLVIAPKLAGTSVDLKEVSKIMGELGLSSKTISSTTIYIDSYPHLSILGSVWPKHLAWLRFLHLKPKGMVVRISSKLFFTGTTSRTINHTLVHEIEHAAQIQRKDPRLLIGYLTQIVCLYLGLALGLTNQSNEAVFKVLIVGITGLFGLYVGYMFSLHEIQARNRSASYTLNSKPIKLVA